MASVPPPDPTTRVRALFADFLASREAGEGTDFDAYCRDHPSEALSLRRLMAEWERSRDEDETRTVTLDNALSAESAAKGAAGESLLKRLSELPPGSGRYRLDGEIARGGMGAILKVWDENLRRHLAMKVILGSGADGEGSAPDAGALARFLEEAQVTGQLDHPGIAPVHELGLDADGRVYFTMKLVKGRDLKKIFELVHAGSDGWNETRALSVVLRVCEAMAFAHAKGVIHRDLKPANVMVGNFGEVYVMDWGLARVLGCQDKHDIRIKPEFTLSLRSVRTERRDEREETPDSPIVTMDGDVMGTPAYMPPEQARGEVEKISPCSDVYAIGAMLYHLLAGEMPFVPRGAKASPRTVLMRVLEGPPRALHEIAPAVPAELVAICEKAMARETSDRYADTLALAEDLRAYLEHRVVGAYEAGAWAETKKWVQRNKPLAASLAAAMALLAAGLTASLVFKARADQKALEATVQAGIAGENEKLATQKSNDVLSLSAIQDLQDLIGRAEELWPANPRNVERLDAWLVDARALIQGRAADETRGTRAKPGLAQHEAKLAELEARALPQTAEERAAERASHPRAKELDAKRRKSQWMARMLGKSPWPSEATVEAELANIALPSDAQGLNALAWPLVDPLGEVYGDEVKGLLLARRTLNVVSARARHVARGTLACALLRNGRLDEAVAEERRALDDAPEEKKEEYKGHVNFVESAVGKWKGASRTAREEEWATLSREVADLERTVEARRSWSFASGEDRWWHVQLSRLVSELRSFADERTGLCGEGLSETYGWGVQRRRRFAAEIEERTLSGANARARWDEAIASISSSAKYGGLVLQPQVGLLPIGEDPGSHLWEFAHLASGEPAERGQDGALVVKAESGLVLVLIPAGKFWMGAQKTDPAGRNYDPQALDLELPVHEVTLDAYFISKYEMTQGQWERFTGRNPSIFDKNNYSPNWDRGGRGWSALHPVENVSWLDCARTLEHLDLVFPTEAQWENAARAGTSTAWCTGNELSSLVGAANLADRYAVSHDFQILSSWEQDLDDGASVHAPVGSYRPNAFGLHDVVGNVWEICRDAWPPQEAQLPVEGDAPGSVEHIIRGGGFMVRASAARSSIHFHDHADTRSDTVGVRPARELSR